MYEYNTTLESYPYPNTHKTYRTSTPIAGLSSTLPQLNTSYFPVTQTTPHARITASDAKKHRNPPLKPSDILERQQRAALKAAKAYSLITVASFLDRTAGPRINLKIWWMDIEFSVPHVYAQNPFLVAASIYVRFLSKALETSSITKKNFRQELELKEHRTRHWNIFPGHVLSLLAENYS